MGDFRTFLLGNGIQYFCGGWQSPDRLTKRGTSGLPEILDRSWEGKMQQAKNIDARNICLRFVFEDAVRTYLLQSYPTLSDVAQKLQEMSSERYGDPVAVQIVIAKGDIIIDNKQP